MSSDISNNDYYIYDHKSMSMLNVHNVCAFYRFIHIQVLDIQYVLRKKNEHTF